MNAARRSSAALAGAVTALVLLGACSPSTPPDDASGTSSATAGPDTTAPSATATDGSPTTEPTAEPSTGSTGAETLPPGFPDPASLIGGELHTTYTDNGSTTVVNGEDIGLTEVFGACFGGTGDQVCDWSIQGSAQPGEGGIPEPTAVSLLLLLRFEGAMADGTPTWTVVDAVATYPPGGQPALLEYCQGADGVAFYPQAGASAGATIPAAAAWGANADKTALVTVDPAGLSCEAIGD
jgi:hypothetical protein